MNLVGLERVNETFRATMRQGVPLVAIMILSAKSCLLLAQDYSEQTEVTSRVELEANSGVCRVEVPRRSYKTLWLSVVSNHGSGALVDGRYLVTAAHNVANYIGSRVSGNITVRCGYTSKDEYLHTVTVPNVRPSKVNVPSYRFSFGSSRYQHDYAFLDLGEYLDGVASFELEEDYTPIEDSKVHISGYPGIAFDGRTLTTAEGKLTAEVGNTVAYGITTYTGNSGGPVWIATENGRALVAVHVATRLGRVVNQGFLNDWTAWRDSIDGEAQ